MKWEFYKKKLFKFYSGVISFVVGLILLLVVCDTPLMMKTMEIVCLPFEKICESYSKIYMIFCDKIALQDEIKKLKSENETLKLTVEEYENYKIEIEKNSKLESVKAKYKDCHIVPLDVKSHSDDLIIVENAKIENAEIHAGDAVVTENGMIGKVCDSDENSVKILTLNSKDSRIGVYDELSGDVGVLCGSQEYKEKNCCLMTLIPAKNNIKSGDVISTSGMSGLFPKKLRIGTISDVQFNSETTSYVGIVQLCENISEGSINTVYVITDFPEKGS